MTKEEFLRPYSEDELRNKFEEAGFDDMVWLYVIESYEEAQRDIAQEYGSYCIDITIEELIADLRANDGWTVDTVREYAWLFTISDGKLKTYLSQRVTGHGHSWSSIYADQVAYESGDHTMRTHYILYNQDKEEARRELGIFIDSLPMGNNPIFRKAFLDYCLEYDSVDKIAEFASGVVSQYDRLRNTVTDTDELYRHAINLVDGDHDKSFYKAYEAALKNGASAGDAWRFADSIEEIFVNGYFYTEVSDFMKRYNAVWQRELYFALLVDAEGNMSSLCKSNWRKRLKLPPVNEPLTPEDEEFVRIKREILAQGVDEYTAEMKACKAAYGYPAGQTRNCNESKQRQLNHDIANMMFPNEEDYQDYLDGEL